MAGLNRTYIINELDNAVIRPEVEQAREYESGQSELSDQSDDRVDDTPSLKDILASTLNRKWREQARCKGLDPQLFHPDDSDEQGIDEAKMVCSGCPVTQECLDYALNALEKDGIWGGLTPKERINILKNSVSS